MRAPKYVWQDPDRQLTVSLSFQVLAALTGNAAARGLLLGWSQWREENRVVSIEGIQPSAHEEPAGESEVVGLYRLVHVGEALEIQEDDEILLRLHLIESEAVMLLVQPGLSRAALFVAGGDEFSLLREFTFHLPAPQTPRRAIAWRVPRWLFEIAALAFGIVAGVLLIRRFQPPPVAVPAIALKPVAEYSAPADLPSPFDVPSGVPPAVTAAPEPVVAAPAPRARLVKPARRAAREKDSENQADRRPSPFVSNTPPAKAAPPTTSSETVAAAPATTTAPRPAPPAIHTVSVARQTEPDVQIDVQAEPVAPSRFARAISKIPLLRRLHHQAPEVHPPAPHRQVNPKLSARERAEVTDPTLVNVRVYVDEEGKVSYAELLSNANRHPNLSTAAVYAARRWSFNPATQDGQPVPGEMILHYRFAPSVTQAAAAQN